MTVNVLPRPSVLWTVMSPPSMAASRLEMARPSPEPPYCRVVELSAWLKRSNSLPIVSSRHADAGVDHFEAEQGAFRVVADELDRDVNAAGRRELDGVSDQVGEDLPEAEGIGLDGFGDGADVLDAQRESLGLGRRPHHGGGVGERSPKGCTGAARLRAGRFRSWSCRGCR